MMRRPTPVRFVTWLFPAVQALPAYGGETGWLSAIGGCHARRQRDTRTLRARFPGWGILFDPLESVWVAVRGKRTLVASSPEKLTEQVEAATRGESGPDEGEKTQKWRALRKHERG
jgi:hypothetical protein